MQNKTLLTALILTLSLTTGAEAVSVIPQPEVLTAKDGQFVINAKTKIQVSPVDTKACRIGKYLQAFLETPTDLQLPVTYVKTEANVITLHLEAGDVSVAESYTLNVTPERIDIYASDASGLFYGVQTLRQLLPAEVEFDVPLEGVEWTIPCLEIKDSPRYAWRGLMLDESRHFFGKEVVKQLLDRMALYKLNRFHWHLTDSPGWRIEIKRYPKLTSIGGIGCQSDPTAEAKYYTQDEIREIVKYAAERQIEIIPEIDMPGHAIAANRAYPEFSGGGSKRFPDFTFNPGSEKAYEYLTNILKEVTELFPGPWLHYGGDEVHFGNQQWKTNPDIQQMMKKEGLKEIREMEHYFNQRMANVIEGLGKTTMGWDEIVDAGVPAEQAVIMWWRHDKPQQLTKAIEKGYRAVMCPRIPCYFDFVQDDSHKWGRRWGGKFGTVEALYQYPTFPKDYTSAQHQQILGIQACVWTERIQNPTRLEFMTHPRLAALAEAAWTQGELKDWDSFKKRLPALFKRHDILGDYYFNCLAPNTTPEAKGVKK